MNFAFSGLVLLLILLPGIVFRLCIIKSDSLENPLDTSRVGELAYILIPSIFLHLIGIGTKYLISGEIDLENISSRLISNDSIQVSMLIWIQSVLYITWLCGVGAYLGFLLKKIILTFYLDIRYSKIFGITNEWDNLFSGRQFILEEYNELVSKDAKKRCCFLNIIGYYWLETLFQIRDFESNIEIDAMQLDVLVNLVNESLLYSGYLESYALSGGNKIDKLIMIQPKRRYLDTIDESFYLSKDIKNRLIIKGSNISNIFVRCVMIVPHTQAPVSDVISLIDSENGKKQYIQIDVTQFDKEYIEDLIDGLVANTRKEEPSFLIEDVIAESIKKST